MKKWEEIGDNNSCWNRAVLGDMIFVLIESDPASPAAINAWIDERVRLGKNKHDDDKIAQARLVAEYISRRHN